MRSPFRKLIAAFALLLGCATALAQGAPAPQNVLQLSASGSIEVQQDLLTLRLTTTREGAEPNLVQNQLKAALDTALAEARKSALAGEMDVRTGNFSLAPRYTREGRINGWSGTAELLLEGRDFPRITSTAARIQTMTMGGVAFGLSREQRARVETDAQALAIERFKAKASELAKGFGFAGYTLREVSVNSNEQGMVRPMRAMAMEMKSAQVDAPLPVEAGRSTVVVNISGSVQLR